MVVVEGAGTDLFAAHFELVVGNRKLQCAALGVELLALYELIALSIQVLDAVLDAVYHLGDNIGKQNRGV